MSRISEIIQKCELGGKGLWPQNKQKQEKQKGKSIISREMAETIDNKSDVTNVLSLRKCVEWNVYRFSFVTNVIALFMIKAV